MSQAKMTPGPWHVTFYVYQDDPAAPTGRRAQIVSNSAQVGGIMDGAHIAGNGGGVADVRRHGLMASADARAIACLPELVEAARSAFNWLMDGLQSDAHRFLVERRPEGFDLNSLRRILARIDGGGDNE